MSASRDRLNRTPLHYAVVDKSLPEMHRLLDAGLDPSAADKAGWTPLHFAAQACFAEAASLLIERGAVVDAQDAHGNTPLSRAVFSSMGHGEVIRILRDSGADPNLKNHSGISPLALARTIANYDVRQFFSDLPEEPAV